MIAGRKAGKEELLLLGATLKACPLQHLLVLLLTHALTALLNQRSHGAETIAAHCDLRFQNQPFAKGFFGPTPVDPGELAHPHERIFLNNLEASRFDHPDHLDRPESPGSTRNHPESTKRRRLSWADSAGLGRFGAQ
jgi:hypothetical protein